MGDMPELQPPHAICAGCMEAHDELWTLAEYGRFCANCLCNEAIKLANKSMRLKREIAALKAENERLKGALREISKGEGRYNRDPLTHADNCIDDMKALAVAALQSKEGE